MVRIAALLAGLLVILTFNAYACILPVPQSAEMDCSSGTEEPVRGTCDAFLELGPQPSSTSSQSAPPIHIDWSMAAHLLPETHVPFVHVPNPPRSPDLSIHLSIHITVLRI